MDRLIKAGSPLSFLGRLTFLLLAATAAAPLHGGTGGEPGRGSEGLKELKAALESRYPNARSRAVRKLAALGGEDAFELVLGRLADKDAEVADAAQLALPSFAASLPQRGLIRRLRGRDGLGAREPETRMRVAQAIGSFDGPVDHRLIEDALDRREPSVCCAGLRSLEKLVDLGRAGEDAVKWTKPVLKLVNRGGADATAAAALQTLCSVDPEAAARWLRGRNSRMGPQLRGSRLLAAARVLEPGEARSILHAALADDEPALRAMAASVVSGGPHPMVQSAYRADRSDLAALATRLETEPRPALRDLVLESLRSLTALRHRADPRIWRHVIDGLPEGWAAAAPPTGQGPDGPSAKDRTTAQLQRLQPRSDRLAILVDFSGSLWNKRPDGTCRKDLLDPEMDRLLGALDPEGRFLLVPYTGEPHPQTKTPVRADRRGVERAKASFRRANMRGRGNLYDAVLVALEHPEIDRVLVLTDGAPTGGRRFDVDLMIELLLERTRYRSVIFDFVLLDTPGRLQRSWGRLAGQTGGRMIAVDTE